MFNKLKELPKLAQNLLSTKQTIQNKFDSFVDQMKRDFSYDKEFLNSFIQENQELFDTPSTAPYELVNAFDDYYSKRLDPAQEIIFEMIFSLRNNMVLLQDEDKDWFLSLYKDSRNEIQLHISKIYKEYIEELKELYVKKTLFNSFKEMLESGDIDLEDFDDDDEDALDEKAEEMIQRIKGKIKGGIQ